MNYGALLQAYALRTSIAELGHACTVLNYIPEVHDLRKHPLQYVTQREEFLSKSMTTLLHYKHFKARRELTRRFREQYLQPSPNDVISLEEIPDALIGFDCVCCGSDQLWNLNQRDNANGAYYLPFDRRIPSFTYAISFGDGLYVSRDAIERKLPLIKQFDSISVRELQGLEFLSEHDVRSTLALDPTLIVGQDLWRSLTGNAADIGSYILVYGFENAHQTYADLVSAAQKLSFELELPVVNPLIQPKLMGKGFVNHFATGPIEFLKLVQGAKVVCTNSYHGAIFAFLFDRPLITVMGSGSQDSRKATLLKMLGLQQNAFYPGGEFDLDYILRAEYSHAHIRHDEAKLKSLAYLSETLSSLDSYIAL